MAKKRKTITTEDLKKFLGDKKILLDCGHYASPGHNFSNTLVISSTGEFIIICSECYG